MRGPIRNVSHEESAMSSPLPKSKRRNAFFRVVALITFVATLSGTAFALSTNHHEIAITKKEYAFARALVRQEIRQEGAVLTSATLTVSRGKISNPRSSYSCASGQLLNIKLIGNFPHIVVASAAGISGVPTTDTTVRGVNLTADAKSGRVCLIGVQTGNATPAFGAVFLPIN